MFNTDKKLNQLQDDNEIQQMSDFLLHNWNSKLFETSLNYTTSTNEFVTIVLNEVKDKTPREQRFIFASFLLQHLDEAAQEFLSSDAPLVDSSYYNDDSRTAYKALKLLYKPKEFEYLDTLAQKIHIISTAPNFSNKILKFQPFIDFKERFPPLIFLELLIMADQPQLFTAVLTKNDLLHDDKGLLVNYSDLSVEQKKLQRDYNDLPKITLNKLKDILEKSVRGSGITPMATQRSLDKEFINLLITKASIKSLDEMPSLLSWAAYNSNYIVFMHLTKIFGLDNINFTDSNVLEYAQDPGMKNFLIKNFLHKLKSSDLEELINSKGLMESFVEYKRSKIKKTILEDNPIPNPTQHAPSRKKEQKEKNSSVSVIPQVDSNEKKSIEKSVKNKLNINKKINSIVEQLQNQLTANHFISPDRFTDNNFETKFIKFSEYLLESNERFVVYTASIGDSEGFTRFVSVFLFIDSVQSLQSINAIIINPFEETHSLNSILENIRKHSLNNKKYIIGKLYVDHLELNKDSVSIAAKGLHMCNLILLHYRTVNFRQIRSTLLDFKYTSQPVQKGHIYTWETVLNENRPSKELFENNRYVFLGSRAYSFLLHDQHPQFLPPNPRADEVNLTMPNHKQLTNINFIKTWYTSWMNLVVSRNHTLKDSVINSVEGVFSADFIPQNLSEIVSQSELEHAEHFPINALMAFQKYELELESRETYETRMQKANKELNKLYPDRHKKTIKTPDKQNISPIDEESIDRPNQEKKLEDSIIDEESIDRPNQEKKLEDSIIDEESIDRPNQEKKLEDSIIEEESKDSIIHNTASLRSDNLSSTPDQIVPPTTPISSGVPANVTKKNKPLTRVIYPYSSNKTSSVESTPESKNLSQKSSVEDLLEGYREEILLHATRRVELFFLLLIAYYNKKITPSLSKTVLQHGKASNKLDSESDVRFSAAHRSIITSLKDDKTNKWILDRTHLQNELNATDLLPHFVNEFDSILEQDRPLYLKVIEQVSLGKITPIKGLLEFLRIMHRAISDIEHSTFKYPTIIEKLISFIKQGSFQNILEIEKNRDIISVNFLKTSLDINDNEISPHLDKKTKLEQFYLNRIISLQKLILSSQLLFEDGSECLKDKRKFIEPNLSLSGSQAKQSESKIVTSDSYNELKEKIDEFSSIIKQTSQRPSKSNTHPMNHYEYALYLVENNTGLINLDAKIKLVDQREWFIIKGLQTVKEQLNAFITPLHINQMSSLQNIKNDYEVANNNLKSAIQENLPAETVKELKQKILSQQETLLSSIRTGILLNLSEFKRIYSQLNDDILNINSLPQGVRATQLNHLKTDYKILGKIIKNYTQSINTIFTVNTQGLKFFNSNLNIIKPMSEVYKNIKESKPSRSKRSIFTETYIPDETFLPIEEKDQYGRDDGDKAFKDDISTSTLKSSMEPLANPHANNPELYAVLKQQKFQEKLEAKKEQEALKQLKKQQELQKAQIELENYRAALNFQTETEINSLYKKILSAVGDKSDLTGNLKLLNTYHHTLLKFVPKDNSFIVHHKEKIINLLSNIDIQVYTLQQLNKILAPDSDKFQYEKINDFVTDFLSSFKKKLSLFLSIKHMIDPEQLKKQLSQLYDCFNKISSELTYATLQQYYFKNELVTHETKNVVRLIEINRAEYSILELFYKTKLIAITNPSQILVALETNLSASLLNADIDHIERIPMELLHSLKVSLAMDKMNWTEIQLDRLKQIIPNLYAILTMTNFLKLNFSEQPKKISTLFFDNSANNKPSKQPDHSESESKESDDHVNRGIEPSN